MFTIENDYIKIGIKKLGAELTSIFSKETQNEYLWQGDPKFWGRQSPILFPFIGRLKNDTYIVDKTSYKIPQHGFARNQFFELIDENVTKKTFELRTSEETLKIYQYNFSLQISYELTENTLIIGYKVINNDDKAIYFSIGGHPAFQCPIANDGNFTDYYLDFETEEYCHQLYLNSENGLIIPKKTKKQRFKKIPLNYDLFKNDALIFEKIISKSISLRSKKHNNGIKLSMENWDYLAFWTKNNAPFICFEPWMGIADFSDTNQNFKEKIGIQKLDIGKEFYKSYKFSFF